MHVVRHQAICPNLYLPPGTLFRHQVQVCSIVLFAKKCLLPTVAPLCKVVGTPGAITRAILAMPLSYYIRNIVLKPIGSTKNCAKKRGVKHVRMDGREA